MKTRIQISLHAVERYIERHAAKVMKHVEATAVLQAAWPTSIRQRHRTTSGDEIYLAPALGLDGRGLELIVARDGPGRGRQCLVTVLPAGDGRSYRHERRSSVPSQVDSGTEALRVAMNYIVPRADVDPAAREVCDQIAGIAPWALRGSIVDVPVAESAHGSLRDDDRCNAVAVVAQRKVVSNTGRSNS